MFRIFQEILTNVARHSRATRVDIDLDISATSASRWWWSTTASASPTHELHGRKSLGLLGMQERALLFGGEVSLTGTPGHGTRVAVTIPTTGNEP